MSNIIRFPEVKRVPAPPPRDDASDVRRAEILFFTGVRYSRSEPRSTTRPQHRRGKEKIEA